VMTSMTSRVVSHRARVVRANAHPRPRPAGLFTYPPAATHLRAATAAKTYTLVRARQGGQGHRRPPPHDPGRGRLGICATPPSTVQIVGFRRADQVDPILAAADLQFSNEDVNEIEESK
jgi:hypothetical protein